MGRPRKQPEDRAETAVATLEPVKPDPIEIKIVKEKVRNPNWDKYPRWDKVESRPKRRVRFIHNQQPGTPLEATPGVTVVKADGKLGNVYEKYKIEDGEELEMPEDIIKRFRTLIYFEEGKKRNRFSFEEVE